MDEPRIGNQIPTACVALPYTDTRGPEAVALYNSTGRVAQSWQELLMADILAVNEDGLWLHTRYGYSVPRRNGKNEIVAMREMFGLENGQRILHTATTYRRQRPATIDMARKLRKKEKFYENNV